MRKISHYSINGRGYMAVNSYYDYNIFVPQNNGEFSDSIMQNWTEQAIECYSLGGDCSRCSIAQGHYSFVCQMSKVVKSLVKTLGKPQ